MKNFIKITKALSDENRVRSLYALKEGELCVCQLIELLGLAPSTVSKHLSILKQAELIESRKEGRWIYYRIAEEDISLLEKNTLNWFFSSLNSSKKLEADVKRLKEILKIDPLKLCNNQMGGKNGIL